MAPIYKKAVVIGATSGIGLDLAERLVREGTYVVAAGRRRERLDAFAARFAGTGLVGVRELDILAPSAVARFAEAVLAEHADVDCVVVNSGVQRAFDFGKAAAAGGGGGQVDMAQFEEELATNYTAAVRVATAFLPHLQALGKRAKGAGAGAEQGQEPGRGHHRHPHLIFVGAQLGLVPYLTRTPGYNASKAALHSWVTAVRKQLEDADDAAGMGGGQRGDVRLVEVFPPAVRTELHDERHQPDMVNGGEIGMPLAAFTDALYAKLAESAAAASPDILSNNVVVGAQAEPWFDDGGWERRRQDIFEEHQLVVKKALVPFLK